MALNLAPIEFGFFYSAMALCTLFSAITEFGTKSAGSILITKYIAANKQKNADSVFSIIFIFNVGISLILAIVLTILSPYLIHTYFKYDQGFIPFLLLMTYFIFTPVASIYRTGLAALKKFFAFNLVNIINSLIMFAALIIFLQKYQLTGAAFIFSGSMFFASIFGFIFLKKRLQFKINLIFSKKIFKNIFKLCSWMTISGTGISILYSADTICLTWLSDLHNVALYNIALPLMQIAMSIIVMPMVFIPIASELWQLKKYNEIKKYCYLVDGLFLTSVPIVAVLGYYLSPYAITIFFGPQFIQASSALTILWIGMIFYAIAQFNIASLDTGGFPKYSAIVVLFAVILNILLNIVLIPYFGINGAATATATAYFVISLFTYILLMFKLNRK